MNRITCSVALAAVGALSLSASAQLSLLGQADGATDFSVSSGGGTEHFTHQDRFEWEANGGGVLSLSQRDDWTIRPIRTAVHGTVYTDSWIRFTVGHLPVQVTSMAMYWNAKWANGGGWSGPNWQPTAYPRLETAIYEDVDSDGPDGDNYRVLNLNPPLDPLEGNGFRVYGGSRSAAPNYVLAADTSYYMRLRVETTFSVNAFDQAEPSISITNEAGGDLTTGAFDGFRSEIGYRTVPAPGAAGAIGLGLIATGRRCRGTRVGKTILNPA